MDEHAFRQHLALVAPNLAAWADEVCAVLNERFGKVLVFPVSRRLKDPAKAVEKMYRKSYHDPAVQMTDLVGARAVVLLSNRLSPISDFVRTHEGWVAEKSRDVVVEVEKNPYIFDYQSEHYELRPTRHAAVWGQGVGPEICCELQLRNVLQHAYAEVAHDTAYKGSYVPPAQSLRRLARSMALMEATDESLCAVLKAAEELRRPVEAALAASRQLYLEHVGSVELTTLDFVLAEAYGSELGLHGGSRLRTLLAQKPFIYERVAARVSKGGLSQYASVLPMYLVASEMGDVMLDKWPFPTLQRDARLVLSDLGE